MDHSSLANHLRVRRVFGSRRPVVTASGGSRSTDRAALVTRPGNWYTVGMGDYTYPHTIENGAGERLTFVRRVEDPAGDRLEGREPRRARQRTPDARPRLPG